VPYTVRMPQLGESVAEGTVSRWFKRVGERVEEDEALFEVSTDKVETEVPSPAAGWVSEILVQEGQTVPVGTELCIIAEQPPFQEKSSEPGTFEEAVSQVTSEGQSEPVSADARSTMRLGWEPGRTQELRARPSEASTVDSARGRLLSEESRLHAQPSLPRESPPKLEELRLQAHPSQIRGEAPPAPPKPQARVTPEGLRRLEHPELGEEVKPGGPRRGIFSPAVRKKARELGVDLDKIAGTGAGGRITLKDVEAAAAADTAAATEEAAVSSSGQIAPSAEAPSVIEPAAAPTAGSGEVLSAGPAKPHGHTPEPAGTTIPISRLRRRIAEHMQEARRSAAHCFECIDVEMERVADARERYKKDFADRHGYSLTYLPFVALAACNALLELPFVNSRFDLEAGTMTLFDRFVNLGVAVDLEGEGLIVPVIHNAHQMTVWELARRIQDLSQRALAGKLTPDDVTGGTFTITNPGSFGTKLSIPIINTPQVAILSLEAIEDRPVVRGGQVVPAKMVTLGLSWDHRAFDGANAARFLQAVKRRLEGSAEGWDWDALAAPDS